MVERTNIELAAAYRIDLEEMDNDELLEMAEELREESRRLGRMADEALDAVRYRMVLDHALELMTDRWHARIIKGTASYSYNIPTLEALKELMPIEEYDAVVAEEVNYKVNKRKLNRLEKRGDRFREIIGWATTTTAGQPHFEAKRREAERNG